MFIYINQKSKLNGQYYSYHTIDGRVYLTPVKGTTQTQIRMPFNTFWKAVKDGYYHKQDSITAQLFEKTRGIDDNLICMCIYMAVVDHMPFDEIIANNKSRIFDNEKVMIESIGSDLVNLIKNA